MASQSVEREADLPTIKQGRRSVRALTLPVPGMVQLLEAPSWLFLPEIPIPRPN